MYTTKFITRTVALAAVASSLAFVQHEAKAIEFEISSIPGSNINFVGTGGLATVSFTQVAGKSFQIDNVNGGTGSAATLKGAFVGSWTLGPVTTISVVPLVEVAPVSGTGTLTITDASNVDLTATIAWVSANSLKTGPFSVAVLGVQGNISGATYSGTDPDLIAFAAGGPQSGFVSFDFGSSGKSLAQLVALGANNHTTYSGSLSSAVPDSGTTLMLLGLGLCGLAAVRPRNQKA